MIDGRILRYFDFFFDRGGLTIVLSILFNISDFSRISVGATSVTLETNNTDIKKNEKSSS